MSPPASDDDSDTYTVPLRDIRSFGAGIKRKRVHFVPSSSTPTTDPSANDIHHTSAAAATAASHGTSVGDQYLALVLPPPPPPPATSTSDAVRASPAADQRDPTDHAGPDTATSCEVCHLPVASTLSSREGDARNSSSLHESTLAHQVCLSHSHPPSAIDRSRKGLSILASYGWDPDARMGLGSGRVPGILHPVKGKVKRDTVGLGAEVVMGKEGGSGGGAVVKGKERAKKLNAKQVRRMVAEDRRKGERLRETLFSNSEVEKYLGSGA